MTRRRLMAAARLRKNWPILSLILGLEVAEEIDGVKRQVLPSEAFAPPPALWLH
jgi:hypothetical protein